MEIHRDGSRDKKRKYRPSIAPFAVPSEGVKIHLMIFLGTDLHGFHGKRIKKIRVFRVICISVKSV